MDLLRSIYEKENKYKKGDNGEKGKPIITEIDIEKMTKSEKQELLDKMIENGVENLSEHDKKILPLLAK
jgi:hypothetical protein